MVSPTSRIPSNPDVGEVAGLEPLLTERQAAQLLAVSARALQKWRSSGRGPVFIQISSRCIRYRPADLARWQSNKARRSTSEYHSDS